MESDQEPKPADMKPIEINSKFQFRGMTSFELAPEQIVQSVKVDYRVPDAPRESLRVIIGPTASWCGNCGTKYRIPTWKHQDYTMDTNISVSKP